MDRQENASSDAGQKLIILYFLLGSERPVVSNLTTGLLYIPCPALVLQQALGAKAALAVERQWA